MSEIRQLKGKKIKQVKPSQAKPSAPVGRGVVVHEGEEVSRAARAIANDHRHRVASSEELKDRAEGLVAALDQQAHHRYSRLVTV